MEGKVLEENDHPETWHKFETLGAVLVRGTQATPLSLEFDNETWKR
jgi:hypothetical protein